MKGHIASPEEPLDPSSSIPPDLIGEANEVRGTVAGVGCAALVDSGSQVTTVCSSFYVDHLSHCTLHDCKDLLRVEGAGGDAIPYTGYIVTTVGLQGVSSIEVPVLVVNDTAYNKEVPLLIGTNCLNRMEYNPSSKVPQIVRSARQTAERVQKYLEESNGVFGTMHASEDTTIRPGSIQVLCGNLHIGVPIATATTMISSEDQKNGSVVTPCLINLNTSTKTSFVEVANPGERSIVIRKGDKIAQLHKVTVDTTVDPSETTDDEFPSVFDLTCLEHNSTPDELDDVKKMIIKWKHLFSKDSTDLGRTSLLKHRIDLHDNVPIKEKARRIPPHMIDELRDHIQQLYSMGVIEESVSPWSSPVVLVRKKSGELRMCVDYRKLNAKTIKDCYRIPTIEELIDTLSGAKWFATLDLSSGYHQVEIEETDKEKTAFTAGPPWFLAIHTDAIRADKCASLVSTSHGTCTEWGPSENSTGLFG